jgi:uncharacterized membrane protein YhhN
MKKSWIIPVVALVIAALVNFVARATGNAPVAAMVKPALLPLIALTTVAAAGGMESRTVRLLVIAQLLGCAGDIFLISSDLIAFAIGLVCFLVGHVFYCINFGGRSWKGLKPVQWVIAVIVMALAVLCAACEKPLRIIGADAVHKSWPGFFRDLVIAGMKVAFDGSVQSAQFNPMNK